MENPEAAAAAAAAGATEAAAAATTATAAATASNEQRAPAGKGRGRGIRANSEQEPLRRPHQGAGGVSDIVKNSVLSVDAAEFVPKFFAPPAAAQPQPVPAPTPAPPRASVQDRLNIARQAPNVQQVMLQRQQPAYPPGSAYVQPTPTIYPQPYQQAYPEVSYPYPPQYEQYPVIEDYGQYDGGSADYFDNLDDIPPVDINQCLAQLDNNMRTLTMNPGKFDSLVSHLVDTISPFLDQATPCYDIFNMILEQSINEGNFRYSGARLCVHLDTIALGADKPTSTFRDTLLTQCTQKTEEQAESWRHQTKHSEEEEKRCHGLIFFLAELVTQMEPEPASALGKLFIQLISTVLQNPAQSSAKNICQALKLAGHTLERDSSSGNKSDMEQVMRLLSDLVIQGRVDPHVGRMVNSVSELRSGNWGVISSHAPPPLVEIKQPLVAQVVVNEPIFYGPDGQVITEEESRFLEDLAEQELATQEAWENDEEDDMIAEAFEEFLKFSQNNNKANQNNVQTNSNQR